jgi:hypothetical protein
MANWSGNVTPPRYCNLIEALWLVNGGHGATLRHHISSYLVQQRVEELADVLLLLLPRTHLDRQITHHCHIIEAPWPVNGGHGASLNRHH